MQKILIVEDEIDLRQAIRTALEGAGFLVFEASDGQEGVEVALSEHPDLILVDINIPEMNGHEMLAQIREDKWGKGVKAIYLTAFSDAENVVEAVSKNSDQYLVKSNISLEEVVSKVKQVISGYTI
jgi:DNA-binding response OmpR family regulator